MSSNAHSERGIYLAIECGNKEWKLAFGDGKQRREVTIPARSAERLKREVERARERFKQAAATPVYSCYEAGRDGFWIHWLLKRLGIENVVVDPASIEVKRRGKRRKTDRLDARKLLEMLIRYWVYGERKTWSVLHVPAEAQEAARRPHRERERLVKERTGHRTRIRSLLALHGIAGTSLPKQAEELQDWKGEKLAPALVEELNRELERLRLVEAQLKALAQERKTHQKSGSESSVVKARKLERVKGVGAQTGWDLAHEFFWRSFRNRREVGAASGLVGCPYDSGASRIEQGISKAGNARVRVMMTEMAWRWLMFQPQSALSRWYQDRFAKGPGRMRRIGIVALARKLLVALWKYVEQDVVPEGALMKAA
jgi:transposase